MLLTTKNASGLGGVSFSSGKDQVILKTSSLSGGNDTEALSPTTMTIHPHPPLETPTEIS